MSQMISLEYVLDRIYINFIDFGRVLYYSDFVKSKLAKGDTILDFVKSKKATGGEEGKALQGYRRRGRRCYPRLHVAR